MQTLFPSTLTRLLKLLACLLIGKILVATLLSYREYIPPNFAANFLLGRERYFWEGYHWAFYLHIFSGPGALLLGTILISNRFRRRFPRWHRVLGRIQAVCVLFVVAPSGFWMAWYAANGVIAAVGFALLAVLTGVTMAFGWRAAVKRRFDVHRRWMTRCFILLCSAVVVRVNGGLGDLLEINAEWFYIQTAWTSWLVPLMISEGIHLVNHRRFLRPRGTTAVGLSEPRASATGC